MDEKEKPDGALKFPNANAVIAHLRAIREDSVLDSRDRAR
jgi:hypothetical protein